MHSKLTRALLAGAAAASLLLTASTAAGAYERSGDSDRNRGRASSYINPDIGAATANPDVDPGSGCSKPDQNDRQAFTKNVHNDACFLDDAGNKVDGPASFESSGVGFISACPDPDNTSVNGVTVVGPRTAVLSLDKRRCFQSGYQMKGTAGDLEFHARLNNNGDAGTQYVTWCSDANNNGCSDEWNKSSIRIDWSADGTATFSNDSWSSSYSR